MKSVRISCRRLIILKLCWRLAPDLESRGDFFLTDRFVWKGAGSWSLQ